MARGRGENGQGGPAREPAVRRKGGRAGGENIRSVGRGCAGVWDRPYNAEGEDGRRSVSVPTINHLLLMPLQMIVLQAFFHDFTPLDGQTSI